MSDKHGKRPVEPTPISHLIMGDPAQPKDQWKYSALGYKGRTPVHAATRWVYMPWVYAIGLTLAIGWPFLFHGVARVVCAIVWYTLVAGITVLVLVSRAKAESGSGESSSGTPGSTSDSTKERQP